MSISDKSSANFDLSVYSAPQLKALLADVSSAITERRAKDIAELQIKIRAMVGESGYSLLEVLGPMHHVRGPSRRAGLTMYRHPEKPELVWTGRGKRPAWLHQLLENGCSLDQLQVL